MNSTQFDEFAIAQAEFVTPNKQQVNQIAPEPHRDLGNSPLTQTLGQIQTPQRKAKLHDKQRIRLKDAKSWALRRSGCNSTAEIKKYLKILGKKLDLRLTSAWVAVNKEFADSIKQIKLAETFSIGDKVEWTGYRPIDAHICAWFPLVITAIIDGKAQLDMWANPVPLDELVAV